MGKVIAVEVTALEMLEDAVGLAMLLALFYVGLLLT